MVDVLDLEFLSPDMAQGVVNFQMDFLIQETACAVLYLEFLIQKIARVVLHLDFWICNMVQGLVGLDLGFWIYQIACVVEVVY